MMGCAVGAVSRVHCPSEARLARSGEPDLLLPALPDSLVKTRGLFFLTWILSVAALSPSPYSRRSVIQRGREDSAEALLYARGEELNAGESQPASLDYKTPLPLVPDEISAVQNHLESDHRRPISNGVSFRCRTATRLFSHSFPKLGPSLASCCTRNAADTLLHQKAILADPDKSELLEPLLDLQEQLETENYEIAVRHVREKYGDLYDRVRKTDARMHALLAHHKTRGRPLVPGDGEIQIGRPKRCSKGLAAFSLSACAAMRFAKAEAAATAKAAVGVAYERGLLALSARRHETSDTVEEPSNTSREEHMVKLGNAEPSYLHSSQKASHKEDAGPDYLTGMARAAHARIRSYVVDVDELCVRSAVHVLSEKKNSGEAPRLTERTAKSSAYEKIVEPMRKNLREVPSDVDVAEPLPLTIEEE